MRNEDNPRSVLIRSRNLHKHIRKRFHPSRRIGPELIDYRIRARTAHAIHNPVRGKPAANRSRIARCAVAHKIGCRGIRIAGVIMCELDDGGRRSRKDCACDRHCCDRK